MPPQITLAIGRDYDRTRPLMDGRVKVEGVDINAMTLPNVEEVFFRMGRNREFDVAEFSGASYLFMLSRSDPPPFIAIPVFPSKFFRHSCIFVHADSGIKEPKDLKGKIMGCPEWLMTAGLWIRGLLKHEYGVDLTDLKWRMGGEEEPGRTNQAVGRVDFNLPKSVMLEDIPPDRILSDMLRKGEIDALMSARIPSSFHDPKGKVRRLFPDYHAVEKEYYLNRNLFPIMHFIVIRWDVYEKYPWIAVNLLNAFQEAKRIAFAGLYDTSALQYGLPWLLPLLEEQRMVFGEDQWTYGIEPNRATLEAMVEYAYEQGLTPKKLAVEDLFAKETLGQRKI
ncbi:MAG TPA: PhnD/SsuA/transferrin family substrate-binding protein [Candidatus Acidoferrales bacterium]|nr:PhnD/SsuA/transferrin family substrate-binding protein [Candidatus Acidoferrales bacterium]